MKIGIFSNCYLPLVNGVVGVVSLLRKGYLEAGHEVYIFAPSFDDYIDEEEGIFRYRSVDLTSKVKYPVAIPFSKRVSKVLNDLELDIIHSHHPFVLGPLACRVAKNKGIPAVYTFHTQYEQYSHYIPFPSAIVNQISRKQITRYCQQVDAVTTPAESARQILLGYGVTKPLRVIPNPTMIAQPGDGQAIRHKYQLGDSKLLINVGRIAAEKNLGLLLESFAGMLPQVEADTLKLMIVGDGPALEDLKNQAQKLGIAGQVIFTGMVDPKEIPDYLNAADLFVMTSKSEVKPLSQLEALAAGLPIVAVAAPGANDTIISGTNGYLVDEDATSFGKAVLQLLSDSGLVKRFKTEAFKTAAGYAYPRIAADHLTWYQEVIGAYANRS